ncbi:TIGR02285 family protein [bacterium]|nr:TIGR02285 family protein [bacterium]
MKKFLVIAIFNLFIFGTTVSAKEKIKWLVIHWPPFQMLSGADKGMGRFDAMLNLYRQNLPQYDHQTIEMNWARFWSDLKKGEKVCSTFAIKTKERQQFAVFSKVISFGLPLRIIMSRSNISKLGNPGMISLTDLLEDSRFKGVFVEKRSYYAHVDKILKEHDKNIYFMAIEDQNVIQTLLSGRIDYTLEYPYLANYLAEKYQSKYKSKLGSIGVKELTDFATSYLACPKNEWGYQVIRDFDIMLKKVKPTDTYLKIMQIGHTDPNELEIIKEGFEKAFLQME